MSGDSVTACKNRL